MNLYLITPLGAGTVDYDNYEGAVVVASTHIKAKQIHPNGHHKWLKRRWRDPLGKIKDWDMDWAKSPNQVNAIFIGPAARELKAGEVILAAFRAG